MIIIIILIIIISIILYLSTMRDTENEDKRNDKY